MKKLFILPMVTLTLLAFDNTTYALKNVNEENIIYVTSEESITLEDGKTFVLNNGYTITSHKINDNSIFTDIELFSIPPPNGKWDYLGSSKFKSESGIFHSTGGDLKIEIATSTYITGNPYVIQLRESDGIISSLVSQVRIYGSGTTIWELDVRGWPDGSNNYAEFFLRKLNYPGTYVMSYWWD